MAQDGNAGPTGAELARTMRRRTTAAAMASNGIGGLTALMFGIVSPYPSVPDDQTDLLLLNVAVFVIAMGAGLGLGNAWARRVIAEPVERWLV
jgi:hypothetical protein